MVQWLRWLQMDDPEGLMRKANDKFYRRFNYIERNAAKPLPDMTMQEMEDLWSEAKSEGL
jgi:uncharacterized protein YabN with tetrapyrrole methylase and pyrophosphatase domain